MDCALTLACKRSPAPTSTTPDGQAKEERVDRRIAKGRPGVSWHQQPAIEREGQERMYLGVDTHKRTHEIVALDEHGRLVGTHSLDNTAAGWVAAMSWAQQAGERDRKSV